MLSLSERDFLRRGVEMDVRVDGRSRMDARECVQEIGLLPQANGSCRLRTYDGSEVLVGIKMEIGEPFPERPNEGRIVCHVEWYVVDMDLECDMSKLSWRCVGYPWHECWGPGGRLEQRLDLPVGQSSATAFGVGLPAVVYHSQRKMLDLASRCHCKPTIMDRSESR